jgi:hypothetical protein
MSNLLDRRLLDRAERDGVEQAHNVLVHLEFNKNK